MSEAPASVVAAVQEALGCVRGDTSGRCQRHVRAWHPAYPCPTAERVAVAAWAVAYPAALRDAAERLEQRRPHIPPPDAPDRRDRIVQRSTINQASSKLRRWADESETTATEESL